MDQAYIDAGPTGEFCYSLVDQEETAVKKTPKEMLEQSKANVFDLKNWLDESYTNPNSPVYWGSTQQMKEHLLGRLAFHPVKLPDNKNGEPFKSIHWYQNFF